MSRSTKRNFKIFYVLFLIMISHEISEARFRVRSITQVLSTRAELVEHIRAQVAAVFGAKEELSTTDCEILLLLIDAARKENRLIEKSAEELEKALKDLVTLIEKEKCEHDFKAP